MCLLIVIATTDPSCGVLLAGNRDEARDRVASPPGLVVGARRRMLSPRDRRAGGTWLAVNDLGHVAGLTNLAGVPDVVGAPTRGALPHLALDCDDLEAGLEAVRAAVWARPHSGFQLVLSAGRRTAVAVHSSGGLDIVLPAPAVTVLSNYHRLGELALPGVDAAAAADTAPDVRLQRLAPILLRDGSDGTHPALKRGGSYGTVSSSLLAVRPGTAASMIWRYAAGPPDTTPYRDYGNLARRLDPAATAARGKRSR